MLRIVICVVISSLAAFGVVNTSDAVVIPIERDVSMLPSSRDTGEVVFQFNVPTTGTDGMTWDGTHLWLASDAALLILKMDTLGNVIDQIPAPGPAPTGLTWDGEYLWCADHQTLLIYKIDTTGTIVSLFPSSSTGGSNEGLAWMNDTLLNTNWGDNIIWKLNPANGTIWDSFTAPGFGSVGLAWDWRDNCIWNSDLAMDAIYKLTPDGNVITSFAVPTAAIAQSQDLAFDGNYLWLATYRDGIIYKIDIGYVGVEETLSISKELFELSQNHPNPFQRSTEIVYTLPQRSGVSFKVYNHVGQLVRTLVSGDQPAGCHQVIWDGRDDSGTRVTPGVYFYRIEAGTCTDIKKMILFR